MCRFILYLGPSIYLSSLVTEPRNSLIHQSFKAEERAEPLNGDGFGVAWYALEHSTEPALLRSITPAWNNANLFSIARLVKSHCVLAHVRAASQQRSVSEANCHPFVWGRWSFMHNGDVGGFHEIRRALLATLSDRAFDAIGGGTDSEHLFAPLHGAHPVGDRYGRDDLRRRGVFGSSRRHRARHRAIHARAGCAPRRDVGLGSPAVPDREHRTRSSLQ